MGFAMFGFDGPALAFGDSPTSFTWAAGAEPVKSDNPKPGAWTSSEIADIIKTATSSVAQVTAATIPLIGQKRAPAQQMPSYYPAAVPTPQGSPAWVLPVVGVGAVIILGLVVVLAVTGKKPAAKPSSPFATG